MMSEPPRVAPATPVPDVPLCVPVVVLSVPDVLLVPVVPLLGVPLVVEPEAP